MVQKNQRWLSHSETIPQKIGELTRRVQVYDDTVMCAENSFPTGCQVSAHRHTHTQVSYIISGAFRFTVEGETRTVYPGDTILMRSNEEHDCVCLEAGVVLDVFTPMREDFV